MLKASVKNSLVILLFLATVLIGTLSGVNSDSRTVLPTSTKNGQPSQNFPIGKIQVRFFDSVTGYGIQPKTLDEVTLKSHIQEYSIQKVDENSTLFLQVEQGEYDLAATLEGYQTLTTKVSVEEEATPIEILLDPIQTPPEMKEEFIDSLTRPDTATVIGYIVDEKTGRPLAKANVNLSDGTVKSKTNKRGFFILQIPAPITDSQEKTVLEDIIFAKQGYVTQERQHIRAFTNHAIIYQIRLIPGEGRNVIDERQHRNNADAEWDSQSQTDRSSSLTDFPAADIINRDTATIQQKESISTFQASAVIVPTSIRVGTNCTDRLNCTGRVLTMSLEAYCKRSLPAEWKALWDMNSLKAGAVAIRSYAATFVIDPLRRTYDICNDTNCQSFGDSMDPRTNSAVDQTSNVVLVDGNNNIIESLHSRENNNKGCGECKTKLCVYDPICCGDFSVKSHGEGMCQQGSQRWATGTKFSPSGPVPSGNQPKDWMWILNHYYPNSRIFTGTPGAPDLVITQFSGPTIGTRGGTIPISVNIKNQGNIVAGQFRIGFYYSVDSNITKNDIFSGTWCTYPTLKAGISGGCNGNIWVPLSLSFGTYYLGAIIDDQSEIPESNENNNVRIAGRITVTNGEGSTAPRISGIRFISSPVAGRRFWIRVEGSGFAPSVVQVVLTGPGCPELGRCVVPNNVLAGVNPTAIGSVPLTLSTGTFTVYARNGNTGLPSNGWQITVP